MKVLMFGWEFPPLSSGGLGTACYGLTKSMGKKGIEITFVLPYSAEISDADFVKLISTTNIKIRKIYLMSFNIYRKQKQQKNKKMFIEYVFLF